MTSRWRVGARQLIAETIATALEEAPALREDLGALFELVSKAYPYGPRKHYPYKIWLDEVRRAREHLERSSDSPTPLARRCVACKARPGKPCLPIDETDSLLAERELATQTAPKRAARKLAEGIVHSARRSPPSGPLFGSEAA